MFDYSLQMKKLIEDISCRCLAFQDIDVRRILIGVSRARTRRKHGLQAKIVPLKFENGEQDMGQGGEYYRMPEVVHNGLEILYIIYFCLPRFQDLSFDDKIKTVFHELYHINPAFNGDIRRFPGRFYQHSWSEKEYDRVVAQLAEDYLWSLHDQEATEFLRYNYKQLCQRYGEVRGLHIPMPEPILCKRDPNRKMIGETIDRN